ncbi:hypothetical protein INR49_029775 [Caranx melampygus]|nr:hypothetical protein INR49_029775 [Caranx melampygus]
MYPESTTDSPARLSLRQTGSPGMIYSARYGSPKRQLQFYRYLSVSVPANLLWLSQSRVIKVKPFFMCIVFLFVILTFVHCEFCVICISQ